jgi:hypothetical protein
LAEVQRQLSTLTVKFEALSTELQMLRDPVREFRRMHMNIEAPLTEEERNNVENMLKNSKLPEQIRRGFARGGSIASRSPVGRFGEVPSEQVRSTDGPTYDIYVTEEIPPLKE